MCMCMMRGLTITIANPSFVVRVVRMHDATHTYQCAAVTISKDRWTSVVRTCKFVSIAY
eukprot:m.149229 g.149229  ORF g.149229 m.149229 type:complete len:59 (+) comp30645_c1_seq1:251-427(+)